MFHGVWWKFLGVNRTYIKTKTNPGPKLQGNGGGSMLTHFPSLKLRYGGNKQIILSFVSMSLNTLQIIYLNVTHYLSYVRFYDLIFFLN